MKVFLPVFALTLVTLAACPETTPHAITPNDADVGQPTANDAAIDQPDAFADVCGAACTALNLFGCPEGASVDGGSSCVDVCKHTQSGAFSIKPDCIAAASSADQVRACGTVRCVTLPQASHDAGHDAGRDSGALATAPATGTPKPVKAPKK